MARTNLNQMLKNSFKKIKVDILAIKKQISKNRYDTNTELLEFRNNLNDTKVKLIKLIRITESEIHKIEDQIDNNQKGLDQKYVSNDKLKEDIGKINQNNKDIFDVVTKEINANREEIQNINANMSNYVKKKDFDKIYRKLLELDQESIRKSEVTNHLKKVDLIQKNLIKLKNDLIDLRKEHKKVRTGKIPELMLRYITNKDHQKSINQINKNISIITKDIQELQKLNK